MYFSGDQFGRVISQRPANSWLISDKDGIWTGMGAALHLSHQLDTTVRFGVA